MGNITIRLERGGWGWHKGVQKLPIEKTNLESEGVVFFEKGKNFEPSRLGKKVGGGKTNPPRSKKGERKQRRKKYDCTAGFFP